MRKAPEVSISLLAVDPPCSRVQLGGAPAACGQVAGQVLEGAFAVGDRYLLLLSDGIPSEDILSIHLLDARGALLDSASLGSPYATGAFQLLGLSAPDTVRFRFIGDTDWAVQVLDAPQARWPLLGEPRGVRRAFGVRRWFVVRGAPRVAVSGSEGHR